MPPPTEQSLAAARARTDFASPRLRRGEVSRITTQSRVNYTLGMTDFFPREREAEWSFDGWDPINMDGREHGPRLITANRSTFNVGLPSRSGGTSIAPRERSVQTLAWQRPSRLPGSAPLLVLSPCYSRARLSKNPGGNADPGWRGIVQRTTPLSLVLPPVCAWNWRVGDEQRLTLRSAYQEFLFSASASRFPRPRLGQPPAALLRRTTTTVCLPITSRRSRA